MGGDEHPFVLQFRIAAFDESQHVPIRHDVSIDSGVNGDVTAERNGRDTAGRFCFLREFVERRTGLRHQRSRQRRRDLNRGNANAIGPRGQHVALDARRLGGPEVARGLLEVGRIRMVVHVADEHNADGAFLLRRQRLAPGGRGFGGHHAFKGAVRIALARFVIEHHHDRTAHGVLVIVVVPLRRHDAEAGKHHPSRRDAAAAEPLGIEVLAAR